MFKRKKKKRKNMTPQEYVAYTVDMPQDLFEEEIVRQKTNVGQISSMILMFEALYEQLRANKDAVIDLVAKGYRAKEDPEVTKTLNGLYAEMTKLEMKVTYLKTRRQELITSSEAPVDTTV